MTFKEKIKSLSGIHLVPTKFIDHIKAIVNDGIVYVPVSTIRANIEEMSIQANMSITDIKCSISQDSLEVKFIDTKPKINVTKQQIGAKI